MKRLFSQHIILVLIFIFSSIATVNGTQAESIKGRNPEKSLFGKKKKIKTKSRKPKESKKVTQAKKKAEKKQLKIKQDYFDYVDKSKKRAYQIQSPEVQARMRQNQKDITSREKDKKKNKSSATRRGASKYGK